MPANDIGTSLSDFLVDLVGGNSDVKMKGLAAGAGFNPNDKDMIEQIHAAIQKSKDAGPPDIADESRQGGQARVGDAVSAALYHKNHLSLLSSLNDFYSKKFGSTAK